MIQSNCKLNIGLNILNKRKDGYHELDMVMVPIDFSDIIEYRDYNTEGDLILETNHGNIPTDEKNTVRKAYNLYFDNANISKKKIKIFLEKIVPHEAGLGGGSSNAAFVLKELNKKYEIYDDIELEKIAVRVGADVPFFLKNKSARVMGIGEKIEEIENNLTTNVLLIKPSDVGMSTGRVYSYYENHKSDLKMANIDEIINGMRENDITHLEKHIENSLEQLIFKKDNRLKDIKNKIEDSLSKKVFLSGSGSCFFAFYDKDNRDIKKLDKKNVYYRLIRKPFLCRRKVL